MLESAAHAALGNLAAGQAGHVLASEHHGAARQPQYAGDEVERRAFARTVRAEQPHDVARTDAEAHIVHRHQATELLAHLLHVEQQLATGGFVAAGQGFGAAPIAFTLEGRHPAFDKTPQPFRRVLQHADEDEAEDDNLEVAAGADQLGQQHLQLVFDDLHRARARKRAPDVANATQHRHEQVFNALGQAERRRVHRALKVREQPAGHSRHHRRQHKGQQLVLEGGNAHRLGHRDAAFQRADGPARTRVQQVQHTHRRNEGRAPDQHVHRPAIGKTQAEQVDGGHAQQAVVLAQRLHVGHGVVERQRPGQCGQRQVVAAHAQGEETQHHRHHHHQRLADEQRDEGRQARVERQISRGVGAHADERRLAERGQARHPRQQHQPQPDLGIQADVVELGDPKLGDGQQRHQHHQHDEGRHQPRRAQRLDGPAPPEHHGGDGGRVFLVHLNAPRRAGRAGCATAARAGWTRTRSLP